MNSWPYEQNPNESLNNIIWSRVPKTNFVGRNTVKIGAMDAVITFNNGTVGRARVLKELGIVPASTLLRDPVMPMKTA